MKICVIGGAGYVGLITSVGLAEIGHHVVSIDVDEARVRALQGGDLHLSEPGLLSALRRNLEAGRIQFTTDLAAGMRHGDVIFITVATPTLDDGRPDSSQILRVAAEARSHLTGYTVMVLKSTIPVAAVEQVAAILAEGKPAGTVCDVVVNPEFLREGHGLSDFLEPARIVIGTRAERARLLMRELYHPIIIRRVGRPVQNTGGPTSPVAVVETDPASATMIKYASNAFLATRIAFVNEIASMCEHLGADIKDVARGMGYDSRIGHKYLEAGLGYGGPCLEKDLRALLQAVPDRGEPAGLLHSVVEHNDRQVQRVLKKIRRLAGGGLGGRRLGALGLTFKSGTHDIRNSLALRIVDALMTEGAVVRVHDPAAMPEVRARRPRLVYCDDPYEAAKDAVALVILTDWPQFRALDYRRIREEMASPAIVDGRNLLDAQVMERLGFAYVGIGQGSGRRLRRDETVAAFSGTAG